MNLHFAIIVGSTILLLVALVIFLFTESKILEYIAKTLGIVLCTSIVLMFVCVIGTNMKSWSYDKEPWYSEKIVAVKDNNITQGKIYYRHGYIDEELYYQYIEELKNGGYQADRVKASITTIYYDNENPRVDWYKKRKKFLWCEITEPFYKMYVPEGSIISDFSIDLE